MTTDRTPVQLDISQLSRDMLAQANRLYEMAGSVGADEHGFRAMADQLAGWAQDLGRKDSPERLCNDLRREARRITLAAEGDPMAIGVLGSLGSIAERLIGYSDRILALQPQSVAFDVSAVTPVTATEDKLGRSRLRELGRQLAMLRGERDATERELRSVRAVIWRIKELCEADGTNPTVQAIRRAIDA